MREKLKCFEYKVCENRNHTLLSFKIYLLFYVLSACLFVCMPCAYVVPMKLRRGHQISLKLRMVVSHHLGAHQVGAEPSFIIRQCSQLLSHLSCPMPY